VVHNFFPTHKAGTEQYVLDLIRECQSQKIEAAVLIPTHPNNECELFYFESIPIYSFHFQPIISRENYKLKINTIDLSFKNSLNTYQPDIVHFHNLNTVITIGHFFVAKQMGFKVIFTPHLAGTICPKGDFIENDENPCNGFVEVKKCSSCFYNKNKIKKILASFHFSLGSMSPLPITFKAINYINHKVWSLHKLNEVCDEVVAIAPWIQNTFKKNRVNSILIPTNIEVSRSNLKIPTERIKNQIIFVGRAYPLKGLLFLLESLAKSPILSELKLKVICSKKEDTTYYRSCKKTFEKLGFTDWSENLSRAEVMIEIGNSTLIIIPSLSEVAPLVAHEALSVGTPILGSNISALTDIIIDNKNGKTFTLKSQADFNIKLSELINLAPDQSIEVAPITGSNFKQRTIELYSSTCN
jgi:glycosyltransferase involved in cell wall biosynthesis